MVCGGLPTSSLVTLPIVLNSVICGGLRWCVVVCGGLWWFAVICGGLSFSHTPNAGAIYFGRV